MTPSTNSRTIERQQGLAFARRWRERQSFTQTLDEASHAAEPIFPYPHRTCAQWITAGEPLSPARMPVVGLSDRPLSHGSAAGSSHQG